MKSLKTVKTLEREARHKSIEKEFDKLYTNDSQITAICQAISEKLDIKYSTVYRIVKIYNG